MKKEEDCNRHGVSYRLLKGLPEIWQKNLEEPPLETCGTITILENGRLKTFKPPFVVASKHHFEPNETLGRHIYPGDRFVVKQIVRSDETPEHDFYEFEVVGDGIENSVFRIVDFYIVDEY